MAALTTNTFPAPFDRVAISFEIELKHRHEPTIPDGLDIDVLVVEIERGWWKEEDQIHQILNRASISCTAQLENILLYTVLY